MAPMYGAHRIHVICMQHTSSLVKPYYCSARARNDRQQSGARPPLFVSGYFMKEYKTRENFDFWLEKKKDGFVNKVGREKVFLL